MKTPGEIAASYWRAEESRDLDAILDHYHADATFQASGCPIMKGHDEIREFYAASANAFPSLTVSIVDGVESGDRGAFQWDAVLTDPDGNHYPRVGVNLVTVRDGRFVAVRAFRDPD